MNYQKQTQDSGYNLHANNCRKRNNTLRERHIIFYGSQETNANMKKKLFKNDLLLLYIFSWQAVSIHDIDLPQTTCAKVK